MSPRPSGAQLSGSGSGPAVRSYLYAPGHDEKLLNRVFEAGADAVVLDLEDSVPHDKKLRARDMVREILAGKPAWVRVNAPMTQDGEDDLSALAHLAMGVRIPKVESAEHARWAVAHSMGKPVTCTIESARGLMQCESIAQVPGVAGLVLGIEDFTLDSGLATNEEVLAPVLVYMSLVSRVGGLEQPCDGAFTQIGNLDGLRRQAENARRCGFGSKSAVHPSQVPVINDVFTPSVDDIEWARRVLATFEASAGSAAKSDRGEMVDLPVAEKARRVLARAQHSDLNIAISPKSLGTQKPLVRNRAPKR